MARLLQRLSEQHGAITQEYQSDLKLCAQKLVAGFDLSDSHFRGTLMRYAEQRTNSGVRAEVLVSLASQLRLDVAVGCALRDLHW